MEKRIFDMFDMEIFPGNYFVYPGMCGDIMRMRIGKLVGIRIKKDWREREYLVASIIATETSKYSEIDRIGIKCFDRMVLVKDPSQIIKIEELFKSKGNFNKYKDLFIHRFNNISEEDWAEDYKTATPIKWDCNTKEWIETNEM